MIVNTPTKKYHFIVLIFLNTFLCTIEIFKIIILFLNDTVNITPVVIQSTFGIKIHHDYTL